MKPTHETDAGTSQALGAGCYLIDRWRARGRVAGARWQVKVKDTATGKWASESFADGQKAAAKAWALAAIGRVSAGQIDAIRQDRRRPEVLMEEALKRHLEVLRERGRDAKHIGEVESITKRAIAAGITNLAEDGIAAKAASWLAASAKTPMTRLKFRRVLGAVGRTAMRWWPILERDPFLPLQGEGAPIPEPPTFTVPELRRLVADAALSSEIGRATALAIYSGARMREITHLRTDRIDIARRRIDIVPPTDAERAAGARLKRNRSRSVPIQDELAALLPGWLAANTEHLFPGLRPRNNDFMARQFQAHLVAVGIDADDCPRDDRRRSFHSLRHSHAMLALACGEDGLRLQLSLGHTTQEMTGHYTSAAMRIRGEVAYWSGVFQLRKEGNHAPSKI